MAELQLLPGAQVDANEIRIVVIAARYRGMWLVCRHRDRDTWELPGGHVENGETPEAAVRWELYEETGIRAEEQDFELLSTSRDHHFFYDHYCLKAEVPIEKIVLQPGETDAVKWVSFAQAHEMVERRQICSIIAAQFLAEEPKLLARQTAQD